MVKKKKYIRTKATRERMRQSHLGIPHTKIRCKHISLSLQGDKHPFYGKHHSAATIAKMKKAHKGKIISAATCAKMSANMKRIWAERKKRHRIIMHGRNINKTAMANKLAERKSV